jgi:hypothetical protein
MYVYASLTVVLPLLIGRSFTTHTCMHEIVGRMNQICTWYVTAAFWSRRFCVLAWKHRNKAFKDECFRFCVCIYQSDGSPHTSITRVQLHLRHPMHNCHSEALCTISSRRYLYIQKSRRSIAIITTFKLCRRLEVVFVSVLPAALVWLSVGVIFIPTCVQVPWEYVRYTHRYANNVN